MKNLILILILAISLILIGCKRCNCKNQTTAGKDFPPLSKEEIDYLSHSPGYEPANTITGSVSGLSDINHIKVCYTIDDLPKIEDVVSVRNEKKYLVINTTIYTGDQSILDEYYVMFLKGNNK
jgi:hypothetical protein